jgi:hypothetical protein
MKLSDEDRAGLSADEIAAIEAEDEDTDALAALAADEDDENGEGEGGGKGKETPAKGAEGEGEGDGKGKDAGAGAEAGDDADDAKPTASHVTPAVEDYDGKVKTLKDEKKAAWQKYNDGDMTADEYEAIEDRVGEQLRDLHHQQRTHESDLKRANTTAAQEWEWECKRFMRTAKADEGIDYGTDKKLGAELDRQVKAIAGDPENADKSGEWFLAEAHRRVKAIHGVGKAPEKPAGGKEGKSKQTPAEIAAARKPDLSKVAPSVRNAPAAMENAAADDEFAHMRDLKGLKYEQAIAAMTAEQLDRFMGS